MSSPDAGGVPLPAGQGSVVVDAAGAAAEAFDPVEYIFAPGNLHIDLGLGRITALLERMGRPQDRLKFVHVAGTNGKGSTSAYIDSALRAAGYRTGLFTSPHLMDFCERIRVDGQNIPFDVLRDITFFVKERVDALVAETGDSPTEFELMTAIGFEYFARCGCDIVVLEVGLGGRLDSTNAIDAPEVCVITRLGLDHVETLGGTIAEIAREKAGIVKPGTAVVSWPQDDAAARDVIAEIAQDRGASLAVADLGKLSIGAVGDDGYRPFTYDGISYRTQLLGSYQPSNAALAIEALRALRARGWDVSDDAIAAGIEAARWPARFEVVQAGPGTATVVVDGGHNAQGAQVLAESLADVFPGRTVVFLMSVLCDKDYPDMIETLAPLGRAWVCAASGNYRALPASELAQAVRHAVPDPEIPVEAADSFAEALDRARGLAGSDGIVCAFGSLYSVADLKAALGQ